MPKRIRDVKGEACSRGFYLKINDKRYVTPLLEAEILHEQKNKHIRRINRDDLQVEIITLKLRIKDFYDRYLRKIKNFIRNCKREYEYLRHNVDSELLEWYGCEHKCLKLLRRNSEINMENLIKSSRISFYCGSAHFIQNLLFIFYIPLFFLLFYFAINISNFAFLLTLLTAASACIFIYPVAYLNQKYFLTKEPSREKLEEGLAVVKQVVADLETTD